MNEENKKVCKRSLVIYSRHLEDIREVLQELERENIDITVESCERGIIDLDKCILDTLIENKPSIVLIDNDKTNNGLLLYRMIKDKQNLKNIPVIFVGLDDKESKLYALKLGALDYIAKPIIKEEAVIKIKNFIELGNKYINHHNNRSCKFCNTEDSAKINTETCILIINEDNIILEILSMRYRNKGFKVFTAEDAETAEKIIKENSIDLLITDYVISGATGIEFIKKVKRLNEKLKIMVLSSQKNEQIIERALNSGADDYVIKPFSPVELDSRIKRLLE
ncbi:response regulator [Clostridium sp. SYSU_GA19001]|uniref:response regulator n=1 Tax=Clostridium caldaquaticum TaxID=2940653 RepID=UPI0020778756|nr:response regulator [Clostridium caldaquaticum]MCM8709819.1 response regulator [Clostridium caldaquaticum]